MARRRSEPSRTRPPTPADPTVLNIGLVDSPQPLTRATSTAATPSHPRALFDTPPPGTQQEELPPRARKVPEHASQYTEERAKVKEGHNKRERTKARQARKAATVNPRRPNPRRIDSERSDAHTATTPATEARGPPTTKSPTPIPHSVAPEGQAECQDSFDYERATRQDLTRALVDAFQQNCGDYETQEIKETLWRVRNNQASTMDASDGHSEVEVLSQAPLGASGGFILNHPANEGTQIGQGQSQRLNNARRAPRSPFLGYPSTTPSCSYIVVSDDGTEPGDLNHGRGPTAYGIPTSSQSLGDPIPRQSTTHGGNPTHDTTDGHAADVGDQGQGLGLEEDGEPMEEDGEPFEEDGELLEEDGELLEEDGEPLEGPVVEEDDGELLDHPHIAPFPTSAQLCSRRLPSVEPEPEPEPEVLQLTPTLYPPPPAMPAAPLAPVAPVAPVVPPPSSRRAARLDASRPYPSRLNIIERGGQVVQDASAYLTPSLHCRAAGSSVRSGVAPSLPLLRRPRTSQAPAKNPSMPAPQPLSLVRHPPASTRQPRAPAPPLARSTVHQATAHTRPSVTNTSFHPYTDLRAFTAMEDELLSDDEEERAAATARAQGKRPARRSKKPTMAQLVGFEYQVAGLSKALLFAESLLQGAWQTRGTYEGWLKRKIWPDAWGRELGDRAPVVPPSWAASQVNLNCMAGCRGKCKERARPVLADGAGFILHPKSDEDVEHNLAIYNSLCGDRFHFSDPQGNRGPFQSPMVTDSIAEIVFNGPTSIGAILPDRFEAMPDPLIGFVLCIMERCRDEWQTGRHVGHDLNANVMLARYIHHMDRLAVAEHRMPGTMRRLREEWFAHGLANTNTAPSVERAPDRSLDEFAALCLGDEPVAADSTARALVTPLQQRPSAGNVEPSASSSRPRRAVIDNRPPPELMELDEDEEAEALPSRPPSPVNPFETERHEDGRYTTRAKGKGRR